MKLFRKNKLITAPAVIFRGHARTRDVAFTYRMPAGFAGDINRTHPASVEPNLPDPTNFPTFAGQACVIDATSKLLRFLGVVDDTALTDIYGVAVRAFPIQQQTGGMSASFGSSTMSAAQPVDVLKSGYIMVPVQGVPVKGGQVFVWAKPVSGNHVPGGFEAAATGGSTISLPLNSYTFNGGPDANGVCEVIIRA
jgi:hypothetical protein